MRQIFFSVVIYIAIAVSSISFASTTSEYELEAAFVYKFTKFVSWPEQRLSDSFVICMYGNHQANKFLENIAGNISQERSVTTTRIDSLNLTQYCNAIFVDELTPREMHLLVKNARTHNILTISDSENFATDSGMIQLIFKDSGLRFIINKSEAELAGLHIHSALLNLSEKILDDDGSR